MSVPEASLKSRNIRLSFQRFMKEQWSDPQSLSVGWQEAAFDPDGGDGVGPVLESWAAVEWLSGEAGAHGVSLVQIDILTRTATDPLASDAQILLDALTDALRVRRVPMYDYSAVVLASDTEVLIPGNVIIIPQQGGRLGAPSGIVGPRRDGDNWRVTVTYRVRLLSDVARTDYY